MRRPRVFALLIAALVAGCSHPQSGSAGGGKKNRHGAGDDTPVPVTLVEVKREDVPIYLDGLGSVQAFNNATLQPQVTGQLISVPFKEGDSVKSGDLIAQIDPRTYQAQLDQALAKKAQDEAALGTAQLDLKRYQGLVPDGYVTQQQVDQQKATVVADQATIKSDDAAIESARVLLSYCTIRAPFEGVVGIRQVDIGNLVQAGSATGIVVLTQIKPISVSFTLPEQALNQIRKADSQPLQVLALNRDNESQLAQGALLAVDNQIDQTTGTIKLKATFANADKALWPGQFVNVRLLVRTRKDGLTIPAPAVQRGPNGAFVYVAKPDKTAVDMRPVTVAQTEDGVALIDKGLDAGEQVVTDGQYRLQPGSKITVSTQPLAASAGGKPVVEAPSDTRAAAPVSSAPDSTPASEAQPAPDATKPATAPSASKP